MSDRRTFLRGLASLPLIGGSLDIAGNPTAAAVPVTRAMLGSYRSWLFYEHRMATYELAGHDYDLYRALKDYSAGGGSPGADWHFQWHGRGPAGWIDAPQPSSRAAVVLSAVGCPLSPGAALEPAP